MWSKSMARSVFSHHASVFRIGKNSISLILFAQSVALSAFSVLIGWSTLCFLATGDIFTRWLAVRALSSDSPLPTTECLQTTLTAWAWAATFPANVLSQFKLDLLKERASTNGIKHEPTSTAMAELLPNESHAAANVSLLAKITNCSFSKQPQYV